MLILLGVPEERCYATTRVKSLAPRFGRLRLPTPLSLRPADQVKSTIEFITLFVSNV